MYYAYVLKSLRDSSFYYGSSEDLEKRLAENPVILPDHAEALRKFQREVVRRMTDEVPMPEKRKLLDFLIKAKRAGKSVVGYGAPGKGNTLLNYCGIRQDFLDYTVDRNPYKQGKLTPGTHIPIFEPEKIRETKPDYLLLLPWNLREEIMQQMGFIREWGGQFVVPIPETKVYS